MMPRLDWDVTLKVEEIGLALMVASARAALALHKEQQGNYGGRGSAVVFEPMKDAVGCVGEIAVAKGLNLYWSNLLDQGQPDVGFGVEARASRKRPHSMPLGDDDVAKDRPCVMVDCSTLPKARLVGWCYASEGKVLAGGKLTRGPNGALDLAYWVPVEALRPMVELLRAIHDQCREGKA
jgi:hypothetical protein